MKYYYVDKDISQFYYISLCIHAGVFAFFIVNGLINFPENKIMDMNINERPVAVKLGQVRNTRTKEDDNRYLNQQKREKLEKEAISNLQKKKINQQKTTKENECNEKKVKKSEVIGKTESQKETTPKSPNKKNQLEIRKKQNNKKTAEKAIKHEEIDNYSYKNLTVKNKKKPLLFDQLEDISACSSYEECKSIADVHKLQFKNEVIEFIKANWEVPDYLLDKDLKISVLIEFDKNGYITNYEIKKHPDNYAYRGLVESIKKLFYIMTKKPLPVKGKRLNSNSIIFTFAPMHN